MNPGDIILADPDGVIVIPRKDAPQILEDAKKFQAADESKLEAAKNGTARMRMPLSPGQRSSAGRSFTQARI